MKIILMLTQVAVYFSFVWGAYSFFRKTVRDKEEYGILIIWIFGSANMLTSLIFTYLDTQIFVVPILLNLISLVLFWSAVYVNRQRPLAFAFSELQPGPLVTSGPYRFIRHPFYVSYTLAWIAAILATYSFITIVFSFSLVILYVRAAIKEEKDLQKIANDTYRNYMARTGRFFPKIIR